MQPESQSPFKWRPLRTLTPALITLIFSYVIGTALLLLLAAVSVQTESCSEIAIFLCIGAAQLISTIVTLAAGFALGYILLRRKQVGHAGLLLFVTFLTGSILSGLVYSRSSSPIGAYLVISFILFLLFFIFFDWYLNVLRSSPALKTVVLIFFVCAGVALYEFSLHDFGGISFASNKSKLQSELSKSGVTYLVPPPGSTYPQPYDIAAASDNNGVEDYKNGAYFGIDTGPANGTTLYEYPYDNQIDPLKDCGKISSLLVTWNGVSTCKVVTTLSTGTKIYMSTDEQMVGLLIIKFNVAVIYTPAKNMSAQQAYDFLDHLTPLEINSFLETLHQKNSQQY